MFINACVRQESRTLSLARAILERLDGVCSEVDLNAEPPSPLCRGSLEKRERLVSEGNFSDSLFRPARDFAEADTIVIAAPYWDLAFPALLKLYLEQITVCGVTFEYRGGAVHSLCKAKRLVYVTTAGGKIIKNLGFEYIKTLAEAFFSIPEVLCFKAEGLDIRGADTEKIMAEAKGEINI